MTLGPRGLQGTHMGTLKPKNSKSITFTVRGGFFTFWASLAHSVPVHNCLPNIILNSLCARKCTHLREILRTLIKQKMIKIHTEIVGAHLKEKVLIFICIQIALQKL